MIHDHLWTSCHILRSQYSSSSMFEECSLLTAKCSHLILIWRVMLIIGLNYPLNSWELSLKFTPSFHYSGWLNSCLFFRLQLKFLPLTRHKSWGCWTSAICIYDIIWYWNMSGLMNVFFHWRHSMFESPRGQCYFWVLIPYYIIWFLIIWETQSLSHCNWSITTWRI